MSGSLDHERKPHSIRAGRPARGRNPIDRLGLNEGWHAIDLGEGTNIPHPPEDSIHLDPNAVVPMPQQALIGARQRDSMEPAGPVRQGVAAQEAPLPPLRHTICEVLGARAVLAWWAPRLGAFHGYVLIVTLVLG